MPDSNGTNNGVGTRDLLIRIDERQQKLLEEFKDHKDHTAREIQDLRRHLSENTKIISDAKTGFRVISAVAILGATITFQWEQVKNFISWLLSGSSGS